MDRNWMYASRLSPKYEKGVEEFIRFAVDHAENPSRIPCPCLDCCHVERVTEETLRDHLFIHGIDRSYRRWIWNGEEEDAYIPPNTSQCDTFEGDTYEGDRFEDMADVMKENFQDNPQIFENLMVDSQLPLYASCTKFTRLSAVLKLYNLKAAHGWSNKSFTALLEILKDMLPEDNVLPNRTYEAKKMLRSMGLDYERIHACRNDCILYRGKNASFQYCPNPDCGEPRYKREGVPAKVAWYFPIIPRFKRLFSNAEDAKYLTWHSTEKKNDGKLRHPADSPQWKRIDNLYPDFGPEGRNLRLALSTDGMNPHGSLSSIHSTWPVVIVIYNLPPWLSMKRKYMMLSLLISGPKQPGNDIDVYLAPLIDDLKVLWDHGVEVFDAHKEEYFTLRAMLFCTINDFPTYGNLSGYTTKGQHACPVCEEGTCFHWLANYKKTVYMGHQRFLKKSHRYRKLRKAFNEKPEEGTSPTALFGEEVLDKVKGLNVRFGKNSFKSSSKSFGGWKKRSIFFELPYWKDLFVRHCLDVMHIEKNVFDSLVGTLLNIPGKTKDGINARLDLLAMMIRKELAPQKKGDRTYLPPACYTFSRKEKHEFCKFFREIKVPYGYSSNISKLVSANELKLVGLKTHDCHIIMQNLLPVALRDVLPKNVRHAITRLCLFFKKICNKVIDPNELSSLQTEIVTTLCELEMYFPPSFFDIMVHLTVHLVREIQLCGPVYMRWMYPFERYMKVLKGYVNNRNRPEGCIVERYIVEEAVEFCTEFLSGVEAIGIPKSLHREREDGNTTMGQLKSISQDVRRKAHLYVLYNNDEVLPYIAEHKSYIRSQNPSRRSDKWIVDEHNRLFVDWLQKRILHQLAQSPGTVSEHLKWLSQLPELVVTTFTKYVINDCVFYTKMQDDKSTMQNSGVTLVAEAMHIASVKDKNPIIAQRSYYGVIEEIWELDYVIFKEPVFCCKWVDMNSVVQDDELGFTLVNLNMIGHTDEPFVLASQVKQVFYVPNPADRAWSVAIPAKERYMDDLSDKDDFVDNTERDGNSLFHMSSDDISGDDDGDDDINGEKFYLRDDHDEGILVNEEVRPPKKKRKKQA